MLKIKWSPVIFVILKKKSMTHQINHISLFQIPREVPHPDNNSPLDFSNPADIIIYLILPAVFLILYLVVRKKRAQKEK
jgi:hypothetical protein